MSHVFISYSRKQFYFVESLVICLQQCGVSIWFDLQGLLPGTSWKQTLQEGLEGCKGLVLIASRSALRSEYVRAEWQAALAANKPIYVVLFESVQLPPELQQASIFDFRSTFKKKVVLLAVSILRGTVHRDRLPRSNPFHLPTRLPPALWVVVGALWSQVVAFVMITLILVLSIRSVSFARPAALPASFMFVLTWLVLGGYACYFATGFIYRWPLRYLTLKVWLIVFPVLSLWFLFFGPLSRNNLIAFASSFGIALTLIPESELQEGIVTVVDIVFFFGSIFLSILGIQAAILWLRAADTLRWLATGTVPEQLRIPWESLWGTSVRSDKRIRTYRLYYDPADEKLAAQLQQALGNRRRLRPSADAIADIHIALLTNQTPQPWLNQLTQAYPDLLCVIASSIRLPYEEAIVRSLQWVDYRQRSTISLELLTFLLSQGEAPVSTYPRPTVPENMERVIVPFSLWIMSQLLLVLAALNLGVGGATAYTLILQNRELAPLGNWPVAGIAIASVFFWLADRLISRNITYSMFGGVMGTALVSIPLVGTLQTLFPFFGPYGLYKTTGILTGIGLLMAPLLLFCFMRSTPRTWLPTRGSWQLIRQRRPTLALPAWKHLCSGKIPYLLVSMGVAVLLLTRISLVVPKSTITLSPEHFITEIPLQSGGSVPRQRLPGEDFPSLHDITKGSDGNLWFTSSSTFDSAIYRMTPTTESTFPPSKPIITTFLLPDLESTVDGITEGPDGNLWFTDRYFVYGETVDEKSAIGRITPTGSIKKFPIPATGSSPGKITQGPDGNLWFTEPDNNAIGRITPAGVISEFSLPTQGTVGGIATGPDGNLWFTVAVSSGDSIGRITPSGIITEFPLPTLMSSPLGITAGPDSSLWFTESGTSVIGRITPAGVISELSLPSAQSGPNEIILGPDGNFWFTEQSGNNIGRITPDGKVTEFPATEQSEPYGITTGPDGNIWFTESQTVTLGVIQL